MNRVFVVLSLSLVGLVGCGGDSNMGGVTGTVTLDGQPVSDATVNFTPKKAGSPSNGRTDSSGKYELSYSKSKKGAEIGEHTVRVTTFRKANPDAETPITAVPEKIPARYNSKSELTKEVKSGNNTIDLELKSDGPVVQPAEKLNPC